SGQWSDDDYDVLSDGEIQLFWRQRFIARLLGFIHGQRHPPASHLQESHANKIVLAGDRELGELVPKFNVIIGLLPTNMIAIDQEPFEAFDESITGSQKPPSVGDLHVGGLHIGVICCVGAPLCFRRTVEAGFHMIAELLKHAAAPTRMLLVYSRQYRSLNPAYHPLPLIERHDGTQTIGRRGEFRITSGT